MRFWLSVICITVLSLNLVQIHGNEDTFLGCYQSFEINMYSTFNMDDPEIKQFISNACNYFQDRLGYYPSYDHQPNPEEIAQYIKEFMILYRDSIPQSLIDSWKIN